MSKKTNYLFVGLGNPGSDYENSRHSLGRMVLLDFVQKPIEGVTAKNWHEEKKLKALLTDGRLNKNSFRLLLPENMMNNSGGSVKPLIKSKKEVANIVVIHDDVDLPLGTAKISFNRGSGGHRGVESIIKAVKSSEFIRLRLGVSPSTPTGKIKKPSAEKIIDFIIGDFKPTEEKEVKKMIKEAKKIIVSLISSGLDRTMNAYN